MTKIEVEYDFLTKEQLIALMKRKVKSKKPIREQGKRYNYQELSDRAKEAIQRKPGMTIKEVMDYIGYDDVSGYVRTKVNKILKSKYGITYKAYRWYPTRRVED